MSEKDRPTDRPNASDCEQCAALQRQNDFLANDRDGYVQLLTDENNKLRAEVEKLAAALKIAKASLADIGVDDALALIDAALTQGERDD